MNYNRTVFNVHCRRALYLPLLSSPTAYAPLFCPCSEELAQICSTLTRSPQPSSFLIAAANLTVEVDEYDHVDKKG